MLLGFTLLALAATAAMVQATAQPQPLQLLAAAAMAAPLDVVAAVEAQPQHGRRRQGWCSSFQSAISWSVPQPDPGLVWCSADKLPVGTTLGGQD